MKSFFIKLFIYLMFFGSLLIGGCKKQDEFLNAKPNQSLAIPSGLSDYESLLHNENVFNTSSPALGHLSDGDFYINDAIWNNSPTITEANAFIWAKDVYKGTMPSDWTAPYQSIYYANTALDGLNSLKILPNEQEKYNQLKGIALFYRAWAHYNLLQTFSLPYDSASASTILGIPLRLSSDPNVKSVRSTQAQCYDQIISDLQAALPLLPPTPKYITQGSKAAAYGFLARIYLSMGKYSKALEYANDALLINNTLLDYNTITLPSDPTASPFISQYANSYVPEDIFHDALIGYYIGAIFSCRVDSTLYALFDNNDLRKGVFFVVTNAPRYKGTYDVKNAHPYDGIATDELYLIRAESYVRLGDIANGMNDLNTLLINRYKSGTFVPITALNINDALQKVLTERRKELCFRGLKWTDLRRLNTETQFSTTLTRVINGTTYTLPPNDPKYALPIPDLEIQLSGIQQNPR